MVIDLGMSGSGSAVVDRWEALRLNRLSTLDELEERMRAYQRDARREMKKAVREAFRTGSLFATVPLGIREELIEESVRAFRKPIKRAARKQLVQTPEYLSLQSRVSVLEERYEDARNQFYRARALYLPSDTDPLRLTLGENGRKGITRGHFEAYLNATVLAFPSEQERKGASKARNFLETKLAQQWLSLDEAWAFRQTLIAEHEATPYETPYKSTLRARLFNPRRKAHYDVRNQVLLPHEAAYKSALAENPLPTPHENAWQTAKAA
jgi:hypothetical protein